MSKGYERCTDCGKDVSYYYMCDEEEDGIYHCEDCFVDKHICTKEHAEDCATFVAETIT